jgi:hypothetical protein
MKTWPRTVQTCTGIAYACPSTVDDTCTSTVHYVFLLSVRVFESCMTSTGALQICTALVLRTGAYVLTTDNTCAGTVAVQSTWKHR